MKMPFDSVLLSNNMGDFSPSPLHILIYVNDPSPSVQFQVPPSFPLMVSFPNYSGPPFIQILINPFFNRLFDIQTDIRQFVRCVLPPQTRRTDGKPCLQCFYVFFICVTPSNNTNLTSYRPIAASHDPLSPVLPWQHHLPKLHTQNLPTITLPNTPQTPSCTPHRTHDKPLPPSPSFYHL